MGKTLTLAFVAALTLIPAASAGRGDTHDVLHVYVDSPSGVDAEFVWGGEPRAPTLARSLAVFRTPRRPSDELPAVLLETARPYPGLTPQSRRSRLLLTTGDHQIYAYPTRQGDVCAYLVPFGGGNCNPRMHDGALPQVERGLVWGLIDNNATRVDVRIGSRGLSAERGRNAFLLQLPSGIRAPTQIVVHERSGVEHVYTIKRCHAGAVTPLMGANPVAPPPC